MKKISIFGIDIVTTDKIGDVAQLARALDWQSRGRGFESHLLHQKRILVEKSQGSLFYIDVIIVTFIENTEMFY